MRKGENGLRRGFGLIWLAVLLVLISTLVGASRPQSSGNGLRFGLELDGQFVGWIGSAEGGNAFADVVTEDADGDTLQKKHIANVKYEDITINMDIGMGKPLYDWIKSSLDRQHERKNGAIIAADFRLRELSRIEFHNALLTEIGMPALDASSKDAARMTIKVAPEYTRRTTSQEGSPVGNGFGRQKNWLPANFRLRIEGLEQTTARVNKIDAITVKQKVIENAVGDERDYTKEPGKLEFPNLVITFPESHSDSVYQWADSFIIQGQSGDGFERGGTLEYLDSTGDPLFTLTFNHLGVFKVAPNTVEAGADSIPQIKAEMYCEDIRFEYSAKAAQ